MPSLEKSLLGYDLGHLRILAESWGVELSATETDSARKELAASLLDEALILEILESLPPEARAALDVLLRNQGRLPWSLFTRRFGEIQEMGAGRRDREKPHRNPVSIAERLYYRAFIARAFFDTPEGPQEFAYIPDDFLEYMPKPEPIPQSPLGRPARPEEYAFPRLATDSILDDATTFLAARRVGAKLPPDAIRVPARFLEDLLRAANLLTDEGINRDAARDFLKSPRDAALAHLVEIWESSETLNELRQLPHLRFEGAWQNNPLTARRFLREMLDSLPRGKWWSLPAFIEGIREQNPDFQRTGGEYESWFLRRASDGESLQGFEHWDEVEGALIRYLLTEAMYWLGLVDLAAKEKDGVPLAFRVRETFPVSEETRENILVSSQAVISIPRFAPRAFRYQIARFCKWLPSPQGETYRYQITPEALTRARKENLEPRHFLALLRKYVEGEIPPSVTRALNRWALNGTEARVEALTLLRLTNAEVLERLRRSKAARFLGEEISPKDVVLQKSEVPKVLAALAELGILSEDKTEDV